MLVSRKRGELVNQGAIAALQFWRNLIEDGSVVLSLQRGFEIDGFQRLVAMQLTGPWTLGQLKATGVDFGVFHLATRRATGIGARSVFKTTRTGESGAEVC